MFNRLPQYAFFLSVLNVLVASKIQYVHWKLLCQVKYWFLYDVWDVIVEQIELLFHVFRLQAFWCNFIYIWIEKRKN